jgi:hypothetical protein
MWKIRSKEGHEGNEDETPTIPASWGADKPLGDGVGDFYNLK